jgi:MraZ protein
MSLTGEYYVTLDEKGRVSLPAGLRKELNETPLMLTKGADDCLWLYPPAKWKELVNDAIKDNTDQFSKVDLRVRRKYIGPAQEIEVDKAGRIPIAQSLREFAGLTKDCVVLGQIDYIEIWDGGRYRKYFEGSDAEFDEASEKLSSRIKQKRGLSD